MSPQARATRWMPLLILAAAFAGAWGAPSYSHADSGTAISGTPTGASTVDDLPDGYVDGRPDAKYGTYSSVIQASGRELQQRLLDLENKSFGLSQLSDREYVAQAKAVYLLENEIARLYLDIANAPASSLNDFERQSLLANTIRTYSQARHHAERLYENMIRYVDVKLPGPNGQQIPSEDPIAHQTLYSPNYRSDRDLTEEEKAEEYRERLESFAKKGGTMKEIHALTPTFYQGLPAYSQFEYVWLADDSIKITSGRAGHLILAQGEKVKSAGQLVFLKGPGGKFSGMIVTNASGSYKPDILSAMDLSHYLSGLLGIDPDLALVTKGEPLSSQAVKIFLKADGAPAAEIDAAVKALEAQGKEILSRAAPQAKPKAKSPAKSPTKPQANQSQPRQHGLGDCAAVFS